MRHILHHLTIPWIQSAHRIGEGAKPSSKPYQCEGGSSMTSMHSIRNSLIVHILQGSFPKGLTLVLWETLISNSVHNWSDSTARRPCDESGPTNCSHIKILPSPEFRRNCTIHHKLLYSIFFRYHSASAMPSINRPITLFLGGKILFCCLKWKRRHHPGVKANNMSAPWPVTRNPVRQMFLLFSLSELMPSSKTSHIYIRTKPTVQKMTQGLTSTHLQAGIKQRK